MPSQDTFHQERPETNRALLSDLSESARQSVIEAQDSTRATSPTVKTVQAAQVQRLAARLGVDPEDLAKRISKDTLRRLKFPMLSQEQPDGTMQYKHDVGIIRDGVRALLATDHSSEAITQNSSPFRERDGSGRFVKK